MKADIDISLIKGIIFDYGGTLDSGGDHWSEVIYKGYVHQGVEVGIAEFRDAYVYAERELAKTRHILPHHNFHDLLKIKMRLELQHLAQQGLFAESLIQEKGDAIARWCYDYARGFVDKAKTVLEKLARRFPLVLVSNFYGNVESVLKDFGIEKFFDKIVESAVVGVRKPDPKIFELGCEALSLPARNVLVVGDSYKKDIVPAEKCGCQAVWIKGKGWTPEEDAVTYKATITDITELLDLLR